MPIVKIELWEGRTPEQKERMIASVTEAICSSIACALTKATGAPVMVEIAQTSKDEKTIEVDYRVLGIRS